MKAIITSRAQGCARTLVRPIASPSVVSSLRKVQYQHQHQRADVRVFFFKFGKNGVGAEDAGIVGSQGRDDYTYDDVEQYFNYMGFLADEGTYDRMEALLKDRHPIDVILLLAAMENDTPKIEEILRAGADTKIKGLDGKTPMEYASKDATKDLLKNGSRS